MTTTVKSSGQGEGSDALAFCIAGAFAGVVLLPVTQLLDLKAAAGALAAALACVGLALAWAQSQAWRPLAGLGTVLEAWRWSTVAVAGYAVAQRFGIEPLAVYAHAGSRARAMGSFGNAGYLATYLCLSWPLLLAWAGARRNVGLALAWAALFATQSRAGLLALFVQMLAWAFQAWRGGWRPGWPAAAWSAATLAVASSLIPASALGRLGSGPVRGPVPGPR
jgi:hypothetical protein